MAWAPDYVTAAQLKAHLRITDTVDDAELAIVISAASRAIDFECARQFGVTTAQARYYSPDCHMMIDGRSAVAIDDVQTLTSLAVVTDLANDGLYSTTLVNGTDFELWPYNASLEGKPWTHLVLPNRSTTYWPWTERSVKVTALFGWSTVPSVVVNACLIQAARFFVRRNAAFGVAGSPEIGSEVRLLARLDPDVALLLGSVKRYYGAV